MPLQQKNSLLILQQKDDAVLTPLQKAFNQLTKKVASLKQSIQKTIRDNEEMLDMHLKQIVPLETEKEKAFSALALALDAAATNVKLTKKQRKNIGNAILFLCDSIFALREPDEAERALHDRWSDMPYDEERDMVFENMKEQMGGNDAQDFWGGTFSHKEKPKTNKQLEKERLAKEAEALKQKNVRSIYLSLVKVLHPDKAVDEKDRLHKEEMTKKVTTAYKENDFLQLLQLESEWVVAQKHSVHTASDSLLQCYVEALRKQVRELEIERYHARNDTRYAILYNYRSLTPKSFAKEVSRHRIQLKSEIEHIHSDISNIQQSQSKENLLRLTDAILLEIEMANNEHPLDFFSGI